MTFDRSIYTHIQNYLYIHKIPDFSETVNYNFSRLTDSITVHKYKGKKIKSTAYDINLQNETIKMEIIYDKKNSEKRRTQKKIVAYEFNMKCDLP